MASRVWVDSASARDPAYRSYVAGMALAHRKSPPGIAPDAPGHVVEFLKGGKPDCGILIRRGTRCHQVLDREGKQDSVHPPKVMVLSEAFVATALARHEQIEALREIDSHREQLKDQIDLSELWEVLQPEGQEWTLDDLADLYFPQSAGAHGKAALFRALEQDPEFDRRGQVYVPASPECLAQRRQQTAASVRADTWLHQCADWLRALADGRDAPRPENGQAALDLLAVKVLFGREHDRAKEACALAKLAHFHGPQAIFGVLVKASYWDRDENLDLLRHQLPTEFTTAATEEASAARAESPTLPAPRLWVRRVYGSPRTREPGEQAFSIRRDPFGCTVGVHIASPALVMRRDGAVQQDASDRGEALPLPARSVPLLPQAIVSATAITDNALRPTLTVHMRFGRGGDLKRYAVGLCRVRVNRPLGLRPSGDRGAAALLRLAHALRRQRVQRGAVIIPGVEVEPVVESAQVRMDSTDPSAPEQLIVHELTVLANTLIARWCADHGVPAIYRAEDRCAEVVVDPERQDPLACYRQRRMMPKARLQTEPAPHHGLGVDRYAPATEPLRRYTDLLMHQQIVGRLRDGQPPYSEEDLRQALLRTAYARAAARDITAAARRYWLLRHLEGQVGSTFDAVVLETVATGSRVLFADLPLTAFCPSRKPVARGTSLRVKLTRVSARADLLSIRPEA